MKLRTHITVVSLIALAFLPASVLAWGGCRSYSSSRSGAYGGSYSRSYQGGYSPYHSAYSGYNHAPAAYNRTPYYGSYHAAYATPAAYHAPYWGGTYAVPASGVYYNQPSTTVVDTSQSDALSLGTTINSLPDGCVSTVINGVVYYQDGTNWYIAQVGPGGTPYFVVVAAQDTN